MNLYLIAGVIIGTLDGIIIGIAIASTWICPRKKIDHTKKSKGVIAKEFGVSYSLVHALEDRLRDEMGIKGGER